MIKLFRIIPYLVIAALMAPIPPAPVYANPTLDEDRIKAAFVYNFIKFIEWPAKSFSTDSAPIYVCVWGTRTETGLLNPLHAKIAKSREIHVVYTRKIDELSRCHVVYLGKNNGGSYRKVLGLISGQSILSVSDIAGFAENGGLIGLFRSDNQMRFAINLNATQSSGLRMSSRLLKFGKIVQGGKQ